MWIDNAYLIFLIQHLNLEVVTYWAYFGGFIAVVSGVSLFLILRGVLWGLSVAAVEASSKTLWVWLLFRKAYRLGADVERPTGKQQALAWLGHFRYSLQVRTGDIREDRPVTAHCGGSWFHPFSWTLPTQESVNAYVLRQEEEEKAERALQERWAAYKEPRSTYHSI